MPTEEELIEAKLERRLVIELGIYKWRLANYGNGILVDSARHMVEETRDKIKIRERLNEIMETRFGVRTGDWPFTTLIPSSNPKNKPYTVTIESPDGLCTCTCPGFGYRQHCRHLAIALEEARAKKLPGFEHPPLRGGKLSEPTLEELLESSIEQVKSKHLDSNGSMVDDYLVEPEPEEEIDLDELIN